jgi:hypothetical protein
VLLTKVLVAGSARLDLYRYGGDSLQGRYHLVRMHPLSAGELALRGQGASGHYRQAQVADQEESNCRAFHMSERWFYDDGIGEVLNENRSVICRPSYQEDGPILAMAPALYDAARKLLAAWDNRTKSEQLASPLIAEFAAQARPLVEYHWYEDDE